MKKIAFAFVLFIISIVPLISKAQTPDWSWSHYGVGMYSFSQSYNVGVATDFRNNVYSTGYNNYLVTIGGDSLANSGIATPYLLKHSASGDLIWSRKPTYNSSAYSKAIAIDNIGNIYVAGTFDVPHIAFGTDTLRNDSIGSTVYLVKYDSMGNVLWARSAVGLSEGYGISIDDNGNIYMVGEFTTSTIKFNSTILTHDTGHRNQCVFVVKYNPSGDVIWGKTSRYGTGYYWNVSAKENGCIYVTGIYHSASLNFGSTILTSRFSPSVEGEMFLIKYDSSGNLIWGRNISGNYFENGSVVADGLGSVYVAGDFSSDTINFGTHYLVKDSLGYGVLNLFLAKYDSSGHDLWAKTTPAKRISVNFNFNLDSSKRPCLSGQFNAPSPTILGMDTFYNAGSYVAQFDTSGNIVWSKCIASPKIFSSVAAIDNHGDYLLTGYFLDTVIIGPDTLINHYSGYNGELFLTKLAWPLPLIATPVPTPTPIKAYPIPTNGILNISLGEGNFTALNMYDANGKKVYSKTLDVKTNEFQLNTAGFADGVYIIHALRNDGINYQKVVIQH